MRVVEARARTVHATQLLHRLERVRRVFRNHAADERRGKRLQVVVGDAVRLRRKRRIAQRRRAQRIERRGQVAVAADRLDEVRGGNGHLDVRPVRAIGVRRSGGLPRREQRPRLLVHRLRVGLEPFVQLEYVAGVDSAELVQSHTVEASMLTVSSPALAGEP